MSLSFPKMRLLCFIMFYLFHCFSILYFIYLCSDPCHLLLVTLGFCCSVALSRLTLRPHGLQHAKPPCPSSSPRVCSSSCLLHQWCRPAISSSDALFSFCPQSCPASGNFPVSQLLTSHDQYSGSSTSASILITSIQGWSPLRLTGLISLLSKGLSGVFTNTAIWRQQLYSALPSSWSSSHNHTWPLGRP